MKWLLFGLGLAMTLLGLMTLAGALSAIHEILASTCFTTAAVFVSSGAIVEAIQRH